MPEIHARNSISWTSSADPWDASETTHIPTRGISEGLAKTSFTTTGESASLPNPVFLTSLQMSLPRRTWTTQSLFPIQDIAIFDFLQVNVLSSFSSFSSPFRAEFCWFEYKLHTILTALVPSVFGILSGGQLIFAE